MAWLPRTRLAPFSVRDMDGVPVSEQVTAGGPPRATRRSRRVDADLEVGVLRRLGHRADRPDFFLSWTRGWARPRTQVKARCGGFHRPLRCVDAAGDQHVGPSGVGDPVAEALGQGWGEGQFGQDHDGHAWSTAVPINASNWAPWRRSSAGTDVEDAPVGSGGELQVGQEALRCTVASTVSAPRKVPRFGRSSRTRRGRPTHRPGGRAGSGGSGAPDATVARWAPGAAVTAAPTAQGSPTPGR